MDERAKNASIIKFIILSEDCQVYPRKLKPSTLEYPLKLTDIQSKHPFFYICRSLTPSSFSFTSFFNPPSTRLASILIPLSFPTIDVCSLETDLAVHHHPHFSSCRTRFQSVSPFLSNLSLPSIPSLVTMPM